MVRPYYHHEFLTCQISHCFCTTFLPAVSVFLLTSNCGSLLSVKPSSKPYIGGLYPFYSGYPFHPDQIIHMRSADSLTSFARVLLVVAEICFLLFEICGIVRKASNPCLGWWRDSVLIRRSLFFSLPDLTERATRFGGVSDQNRVREHAIREWGWAVPTVAAIDALIGIIDETESKSLVEIGAGSGFWCHVLEQQLLQRRIHHFSIHAVDKNTDRYEGKCWFETVNGCVADIDKYPTDSVLLLVWPPAWDTMASDALDRFRGSTLAYVGEQAGGATADSKFHSMLCKNWGLRGSYNLPQ